MRILGGAGQSSLSLQRRLLQRGFSVEAAGRAVARCRELGYVDDGALAESLAARHRRAHHGRVRIAADLRRRGVADAAVDAVISGLAHDEQDAAVTAAAQLRRRVAREGALDQRELQRIGAALQRRGFSGDVIVRALRSLD